MSKFDEAVRVSLSAGQDYLNALQDLRDITRELGDSVKKATGDAVTVDFSSTGTVLGKVIKELISGPQPGVDPDDRLQTAVVVAKGKHAERVLWKVKWSPNGYPMTVIAPDDSVILCVTREDLEQTFIELLKQGATGRKIRVLQENSTKQAS
jgi:hypothetical protein